MDQFGGPEVLQVKDSLPVPSYSPSQVLVKVFSFGINPVETYIRQGQYARYQLTMTFTFIHAFVQRVNNKLYKRHPGCDKCALQISVYLFRLPTLPYTPGGDAAGVVEAVGAEVKSFSVGDRVFVCGQNSGSYAEYVASEASMTFPLHSSVSFSQGAALGVPYFTAFRALNFVGKLKKGENLLVHGVRKAKYYSSKFH